MSNVGYRRYNTDAETIRQLIALNSGIVTVKKLDAGQLIIELTPKGRRFARVLLERALKRRKNILSGLEIVKTQFGALPLTQLLRYVYILYPEYITRSEIIEKLFPHYPTAACNSRVDKSKIWYIIY